MADTVNNENNYIKPNGEDSYIQGIALQPGIDTETGIWGYGYSPDNGAHFYVINSIFGRKYRQEDADRLWPYLKSHTGSSDTLNTSDTTTNKKPSDYSDGIFYELKSSTAVDLSELTVEGVVTTKAFTNGSNEHVAVQTFEPISGDGQVYHRNGSADIWNTWR